MDVEIIRKLRLAQPFKQFYVILKGGKRLFVDEPYHLGIASDGSHLMVCPYGTDPHHLWPHDLAGVDVVSEQSA